MTSEGHAKVLVHKARKQAHMTMKGHAKALVLKPTEETSRNDRERASKGAHPQTNRGNKQT